MIIYGSGGHSKVVLDIAESRNIVIDFFVDDNPEITAQNNLQVLLPAEVDFKNKELTIAIGNNKTREKIFRKFENISTFRTLIHKSAVISHFANIGEGTVVMPNVTVNSSANIGKHCILNTGSIVEHDCILEDFVHISPNAAVAGNVSIGKGTHIGTGACVIPNIKIGENVVIGAGSVVIKDVPSNVIVAGNPAKIIKKLICEFEGE